MRIVNKENKSSFNRVCFHCKTNIEMSRNEDNNDVVYFDGHYYHIQCFKDMAGIKKKCFCCGNDIIIKNVDSSVIYYDKHYFHKDCFIKYCNEKNTKKWKTALEYFDKHLDEGNKKIQELFSKKKMNVLGIESYKNNARHMINNWFAESDVNAFIREQYKIQNLNNIYLRYLKKIYNGTYRNLNGTKIPPEHLLDMWKRKLNYLTKVHSKNIVKGKEMDSEQQIAYDLTVLISKYNSYLEWLNKQSVLENNIDKINENIITNIDLQALSKRTNKVNNDDNEEIDDLLDEIFD